MKKILLGFLFLITLVSVQKTCAQDARFSQYFNTPLLQNAGLAGNGIEYIRVTGIYRTQWAGFGTPFTTQGFNIDKVVGKVGFGAALVRNGAGDASIKTLNVLGNLSYNMPLGYEGNNTLSAGLQFGIVNKSFDPSKLTFDNQYNPDQGYDPNISSGEIFENTSITRPDVNVGVMWQRGWLNKDIRFKPFAGIGISHLTKPKETFAIESVNIKMKQTVYGGAGYMFTPKTEVIPSVVYTTQGTFSELVFGSMLTYKLDNKNSVQLGVYNRMNDAFITYAGYQMNQLFVGMSYDINTGELSKTGKGTNAFELSLTYSPRPKKQKEPKSPKRKEEAATTTAEPIEAPQIRTELTQEIAVREELPDNSDENTIHTKRDNTTVTAAETTGATEVQVTEAPVPKTIAAPVATQTEIIETPPAEDPHETVNISEASSVAVSEIPSEQVTVPGNLNVPQATSETVMETPPADELPEPVSITETVPVAVDAIPAEDLKVPSNLNAPETTSEAVMETPPAEDSHIPVTPVTVSEVPAHAIEVPDLVTEPHVELPAVIETAPEEEHEPVQEINTVPVSKPEVEKTKIEIPAVIESNKPVIDSDNDGIMDDNDACPFIKGPASTGGCPDSDGDGIIDSKDDCPLESGPASNRGCPDPNVPVKVNMEKVRTYDNILFATGSTRLTTGDIYDIIERAIDVLYADPTTSVLLSGHTDSEGADAFNMKLSEDRANVVKAYLLKAGIDESRIQIVAYGETMPLKNNLFEENRKLNRRVELNIIRLK